jgi:hypothetical protein
MSMTDPLFRFPQLASFSTWRNLFISFFGKVWRVVRTSQSKLEFLLHVEGLYGNPRNTHPTSRFRAPNGLLEYYNKTRSRTIDEIQSLIFGLSFNEHSLWWSSILCTKEKPSLRQPSSQP